MASLASTQADLGGKKLYAVNYNARWGKDWDTGHTKCRWKQDIDPDFDALKQITDKIRIYSLTDCDPMPVLQSAAERGLGVWLGIWTTGNWNDLWPEKNKLSYLIDQGYYGAKILGIHVGSEAIYRKSIDAQNAIWMMENIRDMLHSRGQNYPVTIADTIDSYNNHPELVDAVDIVSVNQFSFWEKMDANEGMADMLDRLRDVRVLAAKKNKEVMIGETGWSTAGQSNKASVASMDNQATFLKDFYHQATLRNWKYYWYEGLDAKWAQSTGDNDVEGFFGLFTEGLNNQPVSMKDSLRNLNLGSRPVKVIRSPSQRLYLTEKDGELSLTQAASDWLGKEQQQWLWDESTQQIRSVNSDRCLDAYQAWNGGIVHVYKCVGTEINQKWKFDEASGNLQHVGHPGFCLDTDVGKGNHVQLYGCSNNGNANQKWEFVDPNTPFSSTTSSASGSSGNSASGTPSTFSRLYSKESSRGFGKLVRTGDDVGFGFKAQGEDGSEWSFDSNTHLIHSKQDTKCLDAYEAWDGGRVHVWECNSNEPNQMWDYDSTTGQFKHRSHTGLCLDGDQSANNGDGKVQMYGCNIQYNNNQVWRMVSSDAKAVFPTNADNSILQWVTQDQLMGKSATKQDAQVWFLDSVSHNIISKWSGECIDAYEAKDGGRVHTWGCSGNDNQQWKYDAKAQLVRHVKHTGFCLSFDANDQAQLGTCPTALHSAAQTFTMTAA